MTIDMMIGFDGLIALFDSKPSFGFYLIFLFMGAMTAYAGWKLFYTGFVSFRDYKIVKDTPTIPIRSVALGLVNVCGKAESNQLVTSPFGRTPCCYYRVKIERWTVRKERDGGYTEGWEGLLDRGEGPLFSLVDETGKILIDAHERKDVPGFLGNDLELPVAFQESVNSRFPGLDQYVSTDASGPYRLTEWLVLPGQEYRVVGTCVENPESKDLSDRNLICRSSESTFVISSGAGQAAGDQLRSRAVGYIAGGALIWLIGAGLLGLVLIQLINPALLSDGSS
jgi:hypothetical protein